MQPDSFTSVAFRKSRTYTCV